MMVYASTDSLMNIATSPGCTQFTGQNVTITPPSNGFVVIQVTEIMFIDHTNGARDAWVIGVAQTPTTCVGFTPSYIMSTVDANVETNNNIQRSGSMTTVFAVTGGTTYDFYVNGYMFGGNNAGDLFNRGIIVAVFYPS